MLEGIPSTLLTEWKAFYQLEPFGEWREDLRAAKICAIIANVNRDEKRKPKPFSPADFMPDFTQQYQPDKPPVSLEELRVKMYAVAAAFPDKKTPPSREVRSRNRANR